MELAEAVWISALVIFLYMTLMFLIALARKDNSVVDIAWGIGFIAVALSTLFAGGDFLVRQLLVALLVLIWGLRLANRIYLRNRGKSEDFRYKKWRKDWGRYWVIRSYLQVFLF